MHSRRLVQAVALLAVGNSARAQTCDTTARASLTRPVVRVEVTEMAGDRWRVVYGVDRPTRGLQFERRRSTFRGQRWSAVDQPGTPGKARWTTRGTAEALVIGDAEPPTCRFALEFTTDPTPREKDYTLNLRWSDGSRVLYTGALLVRPMELPDSAPVPTHDWTFRTSQDRMVVTVDSSTPGELRWRPLVADDATGTYVAFASHAPEVDRGIAWLVDGGVPLWIRRQTGALVPRLVMLLGDSLGIRLDRRPLILVSFADPDRVGRSSGGGALPRLLHLHLEGRWREESTAARVQWLLTLAHEIFHLWNAQTYSIRGNRGDDWLVEGGAEYAALLLARALDAIDAREMERAIVEAANDCIFDAGAAPLVAPPPRASASASYSCGAVLHFVGDRATRPGGAGGFWRSYRRLFGDAAKGDGRFTTYDWLEAIHDAGAGPMVAKIAPVLWTGFGTHGPQTLHDWLHDADVSVSLTSFSEATLRGGRRRSIERDAATGIRPPEQLLRYR